MTWGKNCWSEPGYAKIDEKIDQLKTEEARLENLLERVQVAIRTEEQKKAQVPELINKATEEMKVKARQLHSLYKDIKPVLGTADEDNQVIKEIDQIRLSAIKAIRDALGLL